MKISSKLKKELLQIINKNEIIADKKTVKRLLEKYYGINIVSYFKLDFSDQYNDEGRYYDCLKSVTAYKNDGTKKILEFGNYDMTSEDEKLLENLIGRLSGMSDEKISCFKGNKLDFNMEPSTTEELTLCIERFNKND